MSKKLVQIASEIVQVQVSSTPMTAADIASSLRLVFCTLQELQKAEIEQLDIEGISPTEETLPGKAAEPNLTPANSIQENRVICLECGAEFRQLTQKHMRFHEMSLKEYRKKHGFSMRTPLAAKSLIKARSKAAKKRGLPEKLQKFIEARRLEKAKASAPAVAETVTAAKPNRTKLRKKNA